MFKKITAFLLLVCFATSQLSAAFVDKKRQSQASNAAIEKQAQDKEAALKAFMGMSRKSYEQQTGKKLSLKESFQLKMAQKLMKKQMKNEKAEGGGSLPKWAYIVLSIIALGWLAIGIKSNWKTNDWWIALLLYFLFIIPGIIYSLIVMPKYY